MSTKQGRISIDAENMFPIIKKWLYSDKDIFIRELVSNGCDAINKLKRLNSMGSADIDENDELKVTVRIDRENSLLTVEDNGIGMDADEIEKYINQVAFSGASDFFETYKDKMDETNDIIGHFGLGFYSVFMVSDEVKIETLSYKKDAKAVCWKSESGMDFEMSEIDRKERGTKIILKLSDDSLEFLSEFTVTKILEKYCKYLPVPIYVGDEKEKINDTEPLWLKNPNDCKDEEYIDFYKKAFNVYEDPLFWIHLNIDYPFNLKGILYFPKLNNNFDLIEGEVKLFNNQVFVADNIREVIPEFLLLLKGMIDCPDLPLNVSRSFLQNDRDVGKVSKYIVKKVADKFKTMFREERDVYEKSWEDIEVFIKFGCLRDLSFYEKVKDVLIFRDINENFLTLSEYLEQNEEKNKNTVFYVSDRKVQAQYIDMLKKRNRNAVILDKPLDYNYIGLLEFNNPDVKFKRVDADIKDVIKGNHKYSEEEAKEVIDTFKEFCNDKVDFIEADSFDDSETAAIITINEETARLAALRNVLETVGEGPKFKEKSTLTINMGSYIIKALYKMIKSGTRKEDVRMICHHVTDLALLANSKLDAENMKEFIKRSNSLIEMIFRETKTLDKTKLN